MQQKIAILGGGVGAMSAAFALTEPAGWQDRYEVTVYQMGWRLGGKGASGRNASKRDRIEEHGLHIWMGMYENAFHLMQSCYAELGRRPGIDPLATWQDAFKKHSFCTMMEQINGAWVPWQFNVPTNDAVPGQGGVCLSVWSFIQRLLQWLHQAHRVPRLLAGPDTTIAPLMRALRVAQGLSEQTYTKQPAAGAPLVAELEAYRRALLHGLWGAGTQWETDLRRDWILAELAITLIVGLLDDHVTTSFDPLDRYDFREWLTRHRASPTSVWSAPIRCIYELVFAYQNGNPDLPRLGAGVALRFVLRSIFSYQGAFIYFMQAGMGDVVFVPLYRVLQKRGVRFQFFHRVENLGLSADKKSVATIRLGRQVTLKSGDYDPLVTVKGLECWPSHPRAEQFIDSERLAFEQFQQLGIEVFESAWTPWKNAATVTLQKGSDFDLVVLGISLGALKYVCPELVASSPAWQNMVQNVSTVQTQAFQLWLQRSAQDLGWTNVPEPAILDSYRDSWADFSHLIPVESWPVGDHVRSIAYFCNALQDAATIPDPSSDPAFQLGQKQRVHDNSLGYLKTGLTAPLWPLALSPTSPLQLDWTVLVDPTGGTGEQRFDYQFWRANIDPTERYVQSVPNTTQYRLKAGESGFTNLYLAGDWLLTGINAGCVEAAVMGGLQASRALSGYPATIFGETDFCSPGLFSGSAPGYVIRGGEQVPSQPASLKNIDFYAFLLGSNLGALQQLCDRYLNLPGQDRVHYLAFLPVVVLTLANIGRVQATNPPDRDKGWSPEVDAAFQVPLLAVGSAGSGGPLRVVWFQPYLFVDNAWAVAAGREIYGFDKETATFPRADSWRFHLATPGPVFSANTLTIKQFGYDSQVMPATVLEVARANPTGPGGLSVNWNTPQQILADFLAALQHAGITLSIPTLRRRFDLAHLLSPLDVQMVFLKEFRDAVNGSQVCYQQVVEATARVTRTGTLGALAGPYRVTVHRFDSHPIAAELGLAPPGPIPDPLVLEPARAWYVNMDFDLDNGRIV
jgi:uncharacterized protein with NAD-binding domain and iron-sulfur cluster